MDLLVILLSYLPLLALANAIESVEEISEHLTNVLDSLYDVSNTTSGSADKALQKSLYTELMVVTNSSVLTDCEKCITRLELGKTVALERPDLLPAIWIDWCIDSGYDTETSCKLDFGRMTIANSSTGTNFVNMLRLMDPIGYDGQLYCYYKEDEACDLPATPEVDISYMWPDKKPEHYIVPEPSSETFNVLHISDFHLELLYKVGAEANCTDNSMCCTSHNYNDEEMPANYNFTDDYDSIDTMSFYNSSYVNGEFVKGGFISSVLTDSDIWSPANTFGNYYCDAPEVLVNSSLKSISDYQQRLNLDFEFSIFTGDLVDHDELQFQDIKTVVLEEEYIFRDIKYKLQDIPVFSTLGNHDNYPYGQIAQESSGFSNIFNWNAELMTEIWEDYGWLDEDEAKYSSSHYAAFATKTKRGLKIISLNSNTYYKKNFYCYWNATNPDSFGMFSFLVDELIKSEQAGEYVWIMGHIPFVSDSLPVYAAAFTQVIERFSPSTITGIFFGHTHLDQFSVLYSDTANKTTDNIVNNAWITHAVTPWVYYNPAWRYYEVDSKTFQIMNSFNYYTKLNETFDNSGAEPVWQFEYSARDAYNITSWPETAPLNGTFWHQVASKIKSDPETAQQFENYQTRLSPYAPSCDDDDDICAGNWCYLTSFTNLELVACEEEYNVTYSYPS